MTAQMMGWAHQYEANQDIFSRNAGIWKLQLPAKHVSIGLRNGERTVPVWLRLFNLQLKLTEQR